tara:strand:+ start:147 stop:821 length:675 start_codon:yes stop_codon:yes gene_type:complete
MALKNELIQSLQSDLFHRPDHEDSWVNLPFDNAVQIQLELFRLHIVYEKIVASLRDGATVRKIDSFPNKSFYLDGVDYAIAIFLLQAYRLNNKNKISAEIPDQGKYKSLNEIQLFFVNEGLEFSQETISKRLNNLEKVNIVKSFDLKNYRKNLNANDTKTKYFTKYNQYTRKLYMYDENLAEFYINAWKKEDQTELNEANSVNLKKINELSKSIFDLSDIFIKY